jgi:ribosome-associated toxin RatA of RatAB toxin-antitoxin module
MVKVQVSKTVSAQSEKIFSLITDFENLPSKFPDRYKSLKVLERSGNTVKVEETVTVAGREIHQITRHELEPSRRLRSEVLEGDTKGTIVEITLEQDSSKTKVTVDADLKLGKVGAMLGVFAKGKIKGGLEKMIDGFESVVNSS